jgi:hypothetical protein
MSNAYKMMTDKTGKRQPEHRAIMEKHLKRKLSIHEIVHHKDGNKKNNRLSNLEIMTAEEHTSLHHAGSKHYNYKRKKKL